MNWRKRHPNQLENLKISQKPKQEGELRTSYASARLAPSTKDELKKKLDEMDLTLADFLTAVAHGDIQLILKK